VRKQLARRLLFLALFLGVAWVVVLAQPELAQQWAQAARHALRQAFRALF
jgi:hypothetical protein